LRAFE
jgi:hypothetical protein